MKAQQEIYPNIKVFKKWVTGQKIFPIGRKISKIYKLELWRKKIFLLKNSRLLKAGIKKLNYFEGVNKM